MLKYNRTYKLNIGDTIDSISKKFSLDSKDIISYHNTYCNLKNIILYDIPSNVKEITLPPLGVEVKDGKIVDLDKKQKVIIPSPEQDSINIKKLNHTYGVIIKRESIEKNVLQLHYEIHIKYLNTIQQKYYEIELDRKQVYINNKAPDLVAEELSDQLGNVLYPVRVLITKKGDIIDVTNAKEINRRWKNKREKIARYYQSSLVAKLLVKMDKAYASKDSILTALQNNIFLNIYFLYLHKPNSNFKKNYKKKMSTSPFGEKHSYKITNDLEPFLTDTKKIKYRITGAIEDTTIQSKLDFIFKLESSNSIVFMIEGTIYTEKENKKEKVILQAYNLDIKKNRHE